MTARYLSILALSLGAGGYLMGCSGDTTTGTDKTTVDATGDDDDDDDDDTCGDTGCGGPVGGFDAVDIAMSTQFGYSAAARAFTSVYFGGAATAKGEVESSIDVIIHERGWDFDLARTDSYCFYIMPMNDSTVGSWATADPAIYAGNDWSGNGAFGNCNEVGYELDAGLWGDPLTDWINGAPAGAWGSGVGELSANMDALLAPYTATNTDIVDYGLGGQIRIPADVFGADFSDYLFGYAYEADAAGILADDGSGYLVPMLNSAIPTPGGGVANGWYSMDLFAGWTVAP